MRKIVFTLLVLFTVTTAVQSQDKDVVYVEYFSYTNTIGSSYSRALRDKVIEGLTATELIMVKDVDSEASLKREGQRQTEDASAVDEERLVAMKSLNARYLIQGHITNLHADKVTDKEGHVSYRGALVYALKIIDLATGTLKGTESYNYFGSGAGLLATGTGSTPEKAIAAVIENSVKSDMVKFVNKYFPIEGTILEINAEKKGEATEVYIDLGSLKGIQKGQDFKVYVVREIAGKASQKEIGELKATAVEGEELSLCKVGKGGKEIKAAMGEGQTIVIRSFKKVSFLGI